MRDALSGWREELEARFRQEGDNVAPLDAHLIELAALADRRDRATARAGLRDLQEIQKQALFARISMKSKTEEAHQAYLQSAADLKAVQR